MNKRKVGAGYESQAVLYLREQGYAILHQNYRCHIGEIDIIAKDGETLVFIEVKYRRTDEYGAGEFHVDKRKQRTIYKVAQQFLIWNFPEGNLPPCRFDVIAIDGEDIITHYKDAFIK